MADTESQAVTRRDQHWTGLSADAAGFSGLGFRRAGKTHSNLLLLYRVLPSMPEQKLTFSILGNFLLIGGLIAYGAGLFATYHATGKWAKNVTNLLAGVGMEFLALALILRPQNARVIQQVAATAASSVLLWISTCLLLAAMAAFGVITYTRPLRLLHERKLQRDLSSELPKIP